MTATEATEEQIVAAAQAVSAELDTDIVVFSGDVFPLEDQKFNDLVREKHGRKNVLLVLSTFGGSADSAYRIARCLQECYRDGKFYVFVDSYCKSAGTLIAVGASDIIMADSAELGPLDVQMKKPDEIDERASGLTPMQAMFKSIRSPTEHERKLADLLRPAAVEALFTERESLVHFMEFSSIEAERATEDGSTVTHQQGKRNENARDNEHLPASPNSTNGENAQTA